MFDTLIGIYRRVNWTQQRPPASGVAAVSSAATFAAAAFQIDQKPGGHRIQL